MNGGGVEWWQKGVGTIWVVPWLAWPVSSIWNYPASQCSEGKGLLPFRVIDCLDDRRMQVDCKNVNPKLDVQPIGFPRHLA